MSSVAEEHLVEADVISRIAGSSRTNHYENGSVFSFETREGTSYVQFCNVVDGSWDLVRVFRGLFHEAIDMSTICSLSTQSWHIFPIRQLARSREASYIGTCDRLNDVPKFMLNGRNPNGEIYLKSVDGETPYALYITTTMTKADSDQLPTLSIPNISALRNRILIANGYEPDVPRGPLTAVPAFTHYLYFDSKSDRRDANQYLKRHHKLRTQAGAPAAKIGLLVYDEKPPIDPDRLKAILVECVSRFNGTYDGFEAPL